MAKAGEGMAMASCHECHDPIEKRCGLWCSLCRRWFCAHCYRGWHIWNCPKNDIKRIKTPEH